MRLINRFLEKFGIHVCRSVTLQNLETDFEKRINRVISLYKDYQAYSGYGYNDKIDGIVFSKDRAMQLHALLSSYLFFVKYPAPLQVLYTCSSLEHEKAYELLKEEFEGHNVIFIKEQQFNSQLKKLVSDCKSDRIFFMTDDAVFIDHVDLKDCLNYDPVRTIFSMRLGADFNFCYTYNKPQEVPVFDNKGPLNEWCWADMKDSPDWIYPLSVDATVFFTKEVLVVLESIQFKNPNSLESQMQLYNEVFIHRKGVCYKNTKYVNVPCNIVQHEYDNVFTGTYSTDELLEKFLSRQRINWRELEGRHPREVQLTKFSFVQA